jgi:hypothetical protein
LLELPPYELPAAVVARVQERTREEPMQFVARLGAPSPDARESAYEHWGELDAEAKAALVRAGLRAGGAAAIGAAAVADEGFWLDLAETKAAVRAGLPVHNRIDTPFDVGGFYRMFDAEDAAVLLADPGPRPREVPQFLGILHRVLGPKHAPLLERLARSDDWLLRIEAAGYLGAPDERRRVAQYLVTRPAGWDERPEGVDVFTEGVPYTPQAVPAAAQREGFDALLGELIERQFLGETIGDSKTRFFVAQWAKDSRAGAGDLPLLQRLAAVDDDDARRIAVAGLAQLGGDEALATLRAIAAATEAAVRDREHLAPWFAWAALAAAGDDAARRRLADPAAPAVALALAWQVARADALPAIDAAFGAAVDGGRTAFRRVLAAAAAGVAVGAPMHGLEAALVERARRVDLDARRLFPMLRELPATRHDDVVRRAIERLDDTNVTAAPLAVFEVVDAPALARQLLGIVANAAEGSDAIEGALAALVQLAPPLLGDAASVHRLFDLAERWPWAERREELRVRLAAARPAELRERVFATLQREHEPGSWAAAGAVAAAVAALGVDERVALSWLNAYGERNASAEELAAARAVMLPALERGDGAAAIVLLIEDEGGRLCGLDGLWTLPDGVGMQCLRTARDRRELGEHREAIGQLARGGDPEALAVVEHVIRARLYGWLDYWPDHVLGNGHDLDRLPLLLAQLGVNCCTHAVVTSALDCIMPREGQHDGDVFVTEVDLDRAWWQTPRERLRLSRIAGGWVPVGG